VDITRAYDKLIQENKEPVSTFMRRFEKPITSYKVFYSVDEKKEYKTSKAS